MPLPDLIFDIGMHKGEDTDYYLAKGFRVVAIEAVPALCEAVAARHAAAIEDGRLTIVNRAIAAQDGPATFYLNDSISEWSTLYPDRAELNKARGTTSTLVSVEAARLESLLETYGVPYYMKIDIEGGDTVCLNSLGALSDRPTHVSIEAATEDWDRLVEEMDLFDSLGYRRFKIVDQMRKGPLLSPRPAKEGRDIPYPISPGMSGPFGRDLPGAWLSRTEALKKYRRRVARDRIANGAETVMRKVPVLGPHWYAHFGGIGGHWYDTHATR